MILVITSASMQVGRSDNRPNFIFVFPSHPGGPKTMYELPEPFELETNGSIINVDIAKSPPPGLNGWSKVWEIIDFHEFKLRFPDYRTGTHFCYLTGVGTDNESCNDRDCPGNCTMNPYPKFCSCD